MSKQSLKEVMRELMKEAPAKTLDTTSVFQKVPFGQRSADEDSSISFPQSDIQQMIIDFIKKYKIPTGYAEILLRLPTAIEMSSLDAIADDQAWMEFQDIMYDVEDADEFDPDYFQSPTSSHKKLFPKDWKDMKNIKSLSQMRNFKFTGGVKYNVLNKYIQKLFLFMEEEMTDNSELTFPEYTDDFNIPYEKNTSSENELAAALHSWFGRSNDKSANTFKKLYPAIQQAKGKFPKVFSPGKLKAPVYRGTAISKAFESTLKKSKESDWKRFTDDGMVYMVYTKPVSYVPKRAAQSWTTTPEKAKDFNSAYVLITGISDQFFLNDKSSNALGAYEYDEDEIIHVGQKFIHPVFIAVSADIWDEYKFDKASGAGFKDIANNLLGVKPPAAKKAVKKVAKKTVKKK